MTTAKTSKSPKTAKTKRAKRGDNSSADRRESTAELRQQANLYRGIIGIVSVLSLIGLVMILSASSVTALYENGSTWYQVQRQFIWLLLGVAALFLVQRIDYHRLVNWIPWALVITGVLMVLVLMPVIGVNVNGASRWLGWGPLRVQPSELVKLVMILFVADVLTRRAKQLDNNRAVLWPILVVFLSFVALLMLQPNLGTTIILASIVLVMLFIGGIPGKPLGLLIVILVGAAGLAARFEPYRYRRLVAFIDPWADPLNTGFQTIQSQVSLASGGLLGTGLGAGRAKWGFLPEAHTDFIYAIIGEEAGLAGALIVIALVLSLGLLGVRTALRSSDRLGMLIATGVTTWILVQALINVGAVVGVLPITGVPLPFVSAGGSSLVVTMAAVGVLLNVARQAR
ncbi:FtsW Bacterial cell division membrane protein [Acidimicrobiia bacterium]